MLPSEHRGQHGAAKADQWRFSYEDAYVRDAAVTLTEVRFESGWWANGAQMVPPPADAAPLPARTFILEPGSTATWFNACPHII